LREACHRLVVNTPGVPPFATKTGWSLPRGLPRVFYQARTSKAFGHDQVNFHIYVMIDKHLNWLITHYSPSSNPCRPRTPLNDPPSHSRSFSAGKLAPLRLLTTVMFWNKRPKGYPATPKMAPVSLPFDMPTPPWHRIPSIPTNILRDRNPNVPHPPSRRQRHDIAERPVASPPSISGWYSDVERKPRITSMPSDVLPGRRSKTPHPALSRPRYDPPQAQAHRERKPSVVNGATDGMIDSFSFIISLVPRT
jgi:hypothetical protein